VPLPVIAVLVAISPTFVWLYYESSGSVRGRRISAPLMGLGWCVLTVAAVAVYQMGDGWNRNAEWSREFCRFGVATAEQLDAGRVDHVRKELDRFRDGRLREMYEPGVFLKYLREATAAMESGGE